MSASAQNGAIRTDTQVSSYSAEGGSGPASDGSAMFSKAQHFTVSGGTFTNISQIYNDSSAVLSDFRTIRLGDINLQREIGVVNRRTTRRVHIARVEGKRSEVTVAMYEGDGAEEAWREDIALYSSLRHPSFVQLWGITTSSRIHAAIFHDNLIPFRTFVNLHRDSPVLIPYIYAYCSAEYHNSSKYFRSIFQGSRVLSWSWTFLIRCSTGRLCLDPKPSYPSEDHVVPVSDFDLSSNPHGIGSLKSPGMKTMVVSSLSIEQYHEICMSGLTRRHTISFFRPVTVDPSEVYRPPGLPIAFRPGLDVCLRPWYCASLGATISVTPTGGEMMENGWARCL
ncbi:hypothetical protein DFH06DRAFT_1159938 [Mycena polygramma]|nr:hypothetical protein DFH06DRAFT_1159938 [Mycena polygramma]